MKKALAFLLVCCMMISMVACASTSGTSTSSAPSQAGSTASTAPSQAESTPPAKQGGYKIGLAMKNKTNPMLVFLTETIEAEIRASGNEPITFDANNDTLKEANNVSDMIADKLDFIILAALDYDGSAVLVDQVIAAGIPIGIIDSGVSNMDKANFAIMSDNHAAGAMAMEALAEKMGYKGKMVVYENELNYATRQRSEGRKEVLAKYPDIEVVNVMNARLAVDTAMTAMDNFLQADPDITGAWAGNDLGAQGFISALQAAGKKPGDVGVVAVDAADDSLPLIKDGWQTGSAAQSFGELGKRAVELMNKVLAGEELEQQSYLIPLAWVDQSNVDSFVRK